ncbi:short-chain dehydrogenase [Mycobacterium sp. 1245111.1]|uniref:SDR family oxidoreductase n=1 Tax=Mycobacterium sp. 1245111.1 TaxID=1834073 RepID=UPI0007FFBB98|nr:SDR family oxidoreductase [Mycobacterium sp. 1245111.1]OBK37668.1 short-chain dehydrogenase [Mycobacterium sp. 1245111.1]
MAVEVLVTGGDTELGRAVAEEFHSAGHTVTLLGARRDDLEVAAKEIEADAIVCDNTSPAALAEVRHLFPHHLDTIVNIPAPHWNSGDPREYTLSDLATAWRTSLDDTVLSAVLTLETVGDHLRSGGSIISVMPENPRPGSAEAAVKAALSSWVAGQATIFGTRGITVNAVAAGRSAQPGYEGLSSTPPSVAAEVARMSLFLTSGAARHITGQTLHVSHGALTQFA